MSRISIFLIEKSPIFRSALTSILQRLGYRLSNSATSHSDRPHGINRKVVLIDAVTLGGTLQQLRETIQCHARVGPVLLFGRDDRIEQVVTGLKAGAIGFLEHTASLLELRVAIEAVAAGGTFCDKCMLQKMAESIPVAPRTLPLRLTDREQKVLSCVSRGESNKEIAQHLSLSEQSIKIHVSNLLRKTGSSNRRGLHCTR